MSDVGVWSAVRRILIKTLLAGLAVFAAVKMLDANDYGKSEYILGLGEIAVVTYFAATVVIPVGKVIIYGFLWVSDKLFPFITVRTSGNWAEGYYGISFIMLGLIIAAVTIFRKQIKPKIIYIRDKLGLKGERLYAILAVLGLICLAVDIIRLVAAIKNNE